MVLFIGLHKVVEPVHDFPELLPIKQKNVEQSFSCLFLLVTYFVCVCVCFNFYRDSQRHFYL